MPRWTCWSSDAGLAVATTWDGEVCVEVGSHSLNGVKSSPSGTNQRRVAASHLSPRALTASFSLNDTVR